MCRVLGVSRSGYYRWRNAPQSRRSQEDQALLRELRRLFTAHKGHYGSPRLHKALNASGIGCSRKRVARLMRQDGLRAKPVRRRCRTTDSDHSLAVKANALNRQFTAEDINQKWVSDITYVRTAEGWLYVAVVLELYSRRVIGYGMSDRCDRHIVLVALRRALSQRSIQWGTLVLHSDRGSQYCSTEYQQLLRRHGIVGSMSRRGNCWDPPRRMQARSCREFFWNA